MGIKGKCFIREYSLSKEPVNNLDMTIEFTGDMGNVDELQDELHKIMTNDNPINICLEYDAE